MGAGMLPAFVVLAHTHVEQGAWRWRFGRRRIDPDDADERVTPDPVDSARAAGLRYVSDDRPGLRRRRAGRGFRYTRPDGTPCVTMQRWRGSPRW